MGRKYNYIKKIDRELIHDFTEDEIRKNYENAFEGGRFRLKDYERRNIINPSQTITTTLNSIKDSYKESLICNDWN